MTPTRWALFLSGRGSTAQAAMDLTGGLDIRCVYSSKENAYGVSRARRMGLPSEILSKKIDWEWLDRDLRRRGVNRIFLLGFMKLLPVDFVERWKGRILNVHPSLLPAYPGLEAMEKSYQEESEMGVTVHEVVAEMDAGPLLLQKKIRLGSPKKSGLDWPDAQFLMATVEQQLIREAALRWSARGGAYGA